MKISELAGRHGLSRSTLLYYDRMGILSPSERTDAGYRRYTDADEERLARICTYRRAGVPLKEIKRILDTPDGRVTEVLVARLEELDQEMAALRSQQAVIAGLLGSGRIPAGDVAMDKETWVSLLVASGFSDEDMERWHRDFERADPEKHLRFLRYLGIGDEEIASIRRLGRRRDTRGGGDQK